MIRRKVSAALLVRDGFTGQPIQSGSALLCRLNGQRIRPVFKNGGYLVLTDLDAGEHSLSLTARGFVTETVSLTVGGAPLETEIALRPGRGYAFPPDTVRLGVELSDGGGPLAEETFWAGGPQTILLRLAQSVEEAGKRADEADRGADAAGKGTDGQGRGGEEPSVRLFCSGPASLLPVPGHFLLLDEKQPELVRLVELHDTEGVLDRPLEKAHSRGTRLIPVQRFRTDAAGRAELCFPLGGTIALFCRGQLREAEARPGVKEEISWQILS